ncbi:fumarylacetoacetate hydrolase family protein [Salinibaculum salinum]|uniref:fumarylacetoacetate hydrolase family protein n=1 Tax=Salinibaculum salinum TaxID=3131996 RepID=UPI0030EC7D78
MKLARIRTDDGIVTGEYDDGTVTTEEGTYEVGEDADLLAPCEPGTFYCVGRNFAEKIDQMDYDIPDIPDWFIKPAVSLHHPNDPIVRPEWTDELTYAGELAAVIDEECTDLAGEEEVKEVLRGWSILNDLDALDQERRTARKAFDGSGPLGPVIETDLDPRGIDMETHISGEKRQDATTDWMIFDPYETIAFLSERFTFRPGDVISFGSPANPGLLEPGDDIEIWYEGIGTLENTVIAPEDAD